MLLDAAEAAAAIALGHWRKDPKTWDKPDDAGPVTEADLAVDAFLRDTLRAARPDYGWMSEETADDPEDRQAETLFIVDPIDGTRAFARGERTWAHALAVVRQGIPVAGVVSLPARQLCYAAARGRGATLNGAPIAARAEPNALDAADMLVTRPNLAPSLWQGGAPNITRHFRPSLAYRLALVAQGRFDGMLTLRDSWDWDVAAGALLVTEAGGAISDRAGRALRFNTAERKAPGVIAAPARLHVDILERLRPGAWTG
ncbi:MAG: 3'(2'),5'-bisphosphate nucleotidase CysQ [Pseudomonadota bacterium]